MFNGAQIDPRMATNAIGGDPVQARRRAGKRKGLFGKAKSTIPVMTNGEGQPVVPSGPIPGVRPTGDKSISPDAPQAQGEGAGRAMPAAMPHGGPLGGSQRQPFDYEAAMKAMVGETKDPSVWQYALAAVGDALVRNSGGQGYAVNHLVGQRDRNAARQLEAAQTIAGWQYDDWARQNEADLRTSAPYTIGRERLGYNPATGETDVLYRGRQDAEVYADTLGFDRSSEEWNAAVEDYVLKSSGPSAHARDMEIDDYRTGNDRELEQLRYGNRVGLENLRQGNRLQLRRTPAARRGGGGGSQASGVGTVATDGKGNSVIWNGKAWVPNQ